MDAAKLSPASFDKARRRTPETGAPRDRYSLEKETGRGRFDNDELRLGR